MSTAAGAGMVAHAAHYAVVLGGVVGLALLLVPHALERLQVAPRRAPDSHEDRVRRLRGLAAAGRLAEPGATLTGATLTVVRRPVPAAVGPARAALPVALVSSAAAAGVHAAVGPAHLADQALLGIFFLTCAAAQLGWAALVLLRPSRLLLEAGVVGNTVLLGLWVATRLGGAEPVGPWDLAAALWEAVAVAGCVALLHVPARGDSPGRLGGPLAWPVLARGWLMGSALLLGLLSVSGAGA